MTTTIFKSENEYQVSLSALIEAGVVQLGSGASQLRQLQIIEGAIRSYVVDGIHKANFSTIAVACGVTRPLVQHYFETPENLFGSAVRYVRLRFRTSVLAKADKETDPRSQLRTYIRSCFVWMKEQPLHAQFWILFLFRCGSEESYRTQNTEFVALGSRAIEAFLQNGVARREFKVKKIENTARRIQRIIVGGMLTAGTENVEFEYVAKDTMELCALLVDGL